jgi:hypothetical protein
MKEILVTYYVAEDGKKFTSKQECYEYECELKKIHNWFRTLNDIKDFCRNHEECVGCPFLNGIRCGLTGESTDIAMQKAPFCWDFKDWEGFR